MTVRRRDTFSDCHPAVNFLYFGLVLLFTMFFTHPVSLVISLLGAVAYHARLNGKGTVRFSLRLLLPVLVLAAIVNPAFSHEGATILAYLPSGNPLTLESILYGLAAAVMLASVLTWFSCYTAVMTSDKFVYLFGRVIPALSLVLSMTLRFVPRFRAQMAAVREAQKCIGRDTANGSLRQRLHSAVRVVSIVTTWALENAIETADSMRCRGYGLPGRTAYSLYRFDTRDKAALAFLCFCGFTILAGWAAKGFYWRWYPTVRGGGVSVWTVSFQLIYLALCLTPVLMDAYADRRWKNIVNGGESA